jgi:molybdopterin converting factor small subunit
MSEITVLTFGAVTDIIGKKEVTVGDVASTAALKEKLEEAFPALKHINYAVAVNKKMVVGSIPLGAQETVALLPPFSGG